MNLIPLALLTFCIQQTLGQENVKSEFAKTPRRLSDDRPVNFRNNVQKLPAAPTDIFDIRKPTKTDKSYDDFLSFLYRNDKVKPKVKREISASFTNNNDLTRGRRALVFRPLFVYKQQEIKRQRVIEQKKQTKKPVKAPTKPARQG